MQAVPISLVTVHRTGKGKAAHGNVRCDSPDGRKPHNFTPTPNNPVPKSKKYIL